MLTYQPRYYEKYILNFSMHTHFYVGMRYGSGESRRSKLLYTDEGTLRQSVNLYEGELDGGKSLQCGLPR